MCIRDRFYRGDVDNGRVWQSREMESQVRQAIARITGNETRKVLQNGAYDACYLIRERMPLRNWWMDTAVAHHAYLLEAPKRLDFLASIYLDHVQYWKDEGKTKEQEKDDTKTGELPTDTALMEQFWQYNALDCYYTACLVPHLFSILHATPWALNNYRKTIYQFTGPALHMTMRGIRVDETYKGLLENRNRQQAGEALKRLHTMTGTDQFNPNSYRHVQALIYDTMGAKPVPRKGYTTGEKVLEIIKTQHPILRILSEQIFRYKKTASIVSKYGTGLFLNLSLIHI